MLALVFGALCWSGCGTVESDIIYDRTPRPATTKVMVLRGDLDRPYTVIAQLFTRSEASEGGNPMAELLQKAQRLGADALLMTPPETPLKFRGVSSNGPSLDNDLDAPAHVDGRGEAYALTGWAVVFKKQ